MLLDDLHDTDHTSTAENSSNQKLQHILTRAVTGAGRQPGAGKKTGCSRVQNLNLKNFAGLNPDLCRILKSGINRV